MPNTFCLSLQAYAKLRIDTPELLDLVAQFAGQDLTDDPMVVDGESTAPVANSGMSTISVVNLVQSCVVLLLFGHKIRGCRRGVYCISNQLLYINNTSSELCLVLCSAVPFLS